MSGALEIAAVGMLAQQRALEAIADNISNVNTPTFKRSDLRFSELVADAPADPARRAATGSSAALMGVRFWSSPTADFQGQIEKTGNPLDLAIDGSGFVELLGPEGRSLLWRGGRLMVAEDGSLATQAGLPLKSSISVPLDADNLTIDTDGKVSAVSSVDGRLLELGQINLVRPGDMASLERVSGGFFGINGETDLVEAPPGEFGVGVFVQGAIERSNVDLNDEMVSLLLTQRSYAANAQVLRAADELLGIANGLRR